MCSNNFRPAHGQRPDVVVRHSPVHIGPVVCRPAAESPSTAGRYSATVQIGMGESVSTCHVQARSAFKSVARPCNTSRRRGMLPRCARRFSKKSREYLCDGHEVRGARFDLYDWGRPLVPRQISTKSRESRSFQHLCVPPSRLLQPSADDRVPGLAWMNLKWRRSWPTSWVVTFRPAQCGWACF